MRKRIFVFIILSFSLALWLTHNIRPSVQAHGSQNVEVYSFTGTGITQGVSLEWITGSEVQTAGFRMKRSSSADGPFDFIDLLYEGETLSFIQATGLETGAEYIVTDTQATPGQTYWYMLIEIEADLDEVIAFDVISVVAGIIGSPTPTLPVIGGGNTGGNTATFTPTATPTATTLPGQTPVIPNTPVLTNTPVPLATTTPVSGNNQTLPSPTPVSGGSNNHIPTRASTTTGAATSESNGTPIAQITPNPVEAYPGAAPTTDPTLPDTPPDAGGVYPDGQPIPGAEATLSSNPLNPGSIEVTTTLSDPYQRSTPGVTDFGDSNVPGANSTLPAPDGATSITTGGSGRVILWLGFIAGLFIFAAGVFGTILLFTRKQNGPQ